MAIIIKNIDTVAHVYAGMTIEPSESYTIQSNELLSWQNSDALLIDITDGKVQVNDGTDDISGVSNQINFLKDIDSTPRDSDGSPLNRIKVAPSGWHYQLHGLEATTSLLNGVFESKADGTVFNFAVARHYDSSNTLLTTQETINSSCVKTIIDWEPSWDYELIGGSIYQTAAPSSNVRIGIVAAPYVPLAYGGSIEFGTCINLKFVENSGSVKMDGRSPKRLTYDATYHTSMLRLIIIHETGVQHSFLTLFELFKPTGV